MMTTHLGHLYLGLFEQFANEQHGASRAVAGDVILCRARFADHRRRRMLNVHFVQKHVAVLR
jgi:hypothetical protein